MTQPPLDAAAFAAKWGDNARRESASSQEHFIDLCRLLGAPTPNEADPAGADYAFEYPASRTSTGGRGSTDVFRRGFFGWEYKGADRDLADAYRQLLDYRESLGNPPLLVVSDMDTIEVRTNFTDTAPAVRRVALADLAAGGDRTAEALRVLRAVMYDPEALRPERTPDEVTALAAARFAEDAGLLPHGILTGLVESRGGDPAEFARGLGDLFASCPTARPDASSATTASSGSTAASSTTPA